MSSNTGIKTILILAANPVNTAPLRLDEEIREIDEGLRRANKREQFKLEQRWAVRSRDFYRAILDVQPQIVHFCGHGALREWKNNNHDSGALLRGVPLSVAEDWLHNRADEMTQEERDFIQVSAQQRDREKQEQEHRRRLTLIGLGSFSAVALSLAGVAGVGWWNAGIFYPRVFQNQSS